MTEVTMQGQAGARTISDGATEDVRLGRTAELIVQELHARYFETNFRGAVYSDGMGLTSISNSTFTVGGIGATTTPVTGVWNPTTSGVNLVIIEATLGLTMTALAATGPGGFTWALSANNSALTLGATPLNRKTFVNAGSSAKGLTNVALTGITNALVAKFGSSLGGGSAENVSFTATAVAMQTMAVSSKEQFDGTLIVPPGGVLALLANTTPAAHSACSAIVWEEVPV